MDKNIIQFTSILVLKILFNKFKINIRNKFRSIKIKFSLILYVINYLSKFIFLSTIYFGRFFVSCRILAIYSDIKLKNKS